MSEEKEEIGYMHLSDQAIGSIMAAVQQGMLNKKDITDMLRNFTFVDSEDGLIVNNPPRIRVDEDTVEAMEDEDDELSESNVIVDPDEKEVNE